MFAKTVGAGHEAVLVAAGLEALDLARMSLAVAALQFGLGVEEIDLAWTAGLHEEDDGPGSTPKMAGARRQIGAPRRSAERVEESIGVEEVGGGQRSEAEIRLQECPARAESIHDNSLHVKKLTGVQEHVT